MLNQNDSAGSAVVSAVPAGERPLHTDGVRFSPLDRVNTAIDAELRTTFARLLRTSAFILGKEVERFEAEFGVFCGTAHCVGVSSGTAGLELALRANGIGPGDEVIVPAHTFIASGLAVVHAGAIPVLCDVDDGSGLIDPDAARAMVGPRTARGSLADFRVCGLLLINLFLLTSSSELIAERLSAGDGREWSSKRGCRRCWSRCGAPRQLADAIAAFDQLRERGTDVLMLFGKQEALY